MLRTLVKYNDPILHSPAEAVDALALGAPTFKELVQDMVETMYANRGLGLAAPQIGVSKRVAVVDLSRGTIPGQLVVLINPSIVEGSGKLTLEEGCLSLPGIKQSVTRVQKIRVKTQKVKTQTEWVYFTLEAEEALAVVIQHEIDHLNGVTLLNYMSPLKREMAKKKLAKGNHG